MGLLKKLFGFNKVNKDFSSTLNNLFNLIGNNNFDKEKILEYLSILFKAETAFYYIRESKKDFYRKTSELSRDVTSLETIENNNTISQKDLYSILVPGKKVTFIERDQLCSSIFQKLLPNKTNNALFIVIEIQNDVCAFIILCKIDQKQYKRVEEESWNVISNIISFGYVNKTIAEDKKKQIDLLSVCSDFSIKDLDTFFQRFAANISKHFGLRFVSLWLFNNIDNTLVLRSFYPDSIDGKKISFNSFDTKILNCNESVSGQAILSKQPVILDTITRKFKNKIFAETYGLNWFISLPILDSQHIPLGTINIWPDRDKAYFGAETIDFILNHISFFIPKIKHAVTYNYADLLNKYDDIFKSMIEIKNQKTSWDKLAVIISTEMKCEACSIFFMDSDGLLRLRGSTGIVGNPSYETVYYEPNEGLTGTAFTRSEPFIYYSELEYKYKNIHLRKHQDILKTSKKSKSILLVNIEDDSENPIGVIRCENKEETPSRHIGRFTKEDIINLQWMSGLVSNLYLKVIWITEHEIERERNVNSLYHEILSPVDGVLAHIEWMERYFKREESPSNWDKDKIATKFNDIKQISKLIEMLLVSMDRLDNDTTPMTIEHFSCNDLLQICLGFLINESRRQKVEIKIEIYGFPKLKGDPLHMMRVFYNLLRNAIKYRDAREGIRYVRVSSEEKKDRLLLHFEDNGMGIVRGEEEIIFEKFKRGSNSSIVFPTGCGLGLYFCREIIRRHGWDIYLDPNNLSKPTVFTIAIPKGL